MERKRKMEREKQRERERKKSEVVQPSVREDMGGSGLEMGEAIAACAYDAWAHSVSLTRCVRHTALSKTHRGGSGGS